MPYLLFLRKQQSLKLLSVALYGLEKGQTVKDIIMGPGKKKIFSLIKRIFSQVSSEFKHVFWVLERIVSLRWFF